MGARALREWARVWRRLAELPALRRAVVGGEVGWAVARRVVGLATPETEAACLETVRGRTLRAVEAIVAAVRAAEAAPAAVEEPESDQVRVRLPCTSREALLWRAALELARRVAGEELPVWLCAERIAAEAASAFGAPGASAGSEGEGSPWGSPSAVPEPGEEHGLRAQAFPGLTWTHAPGALPARLAALAEGVADASPREIDRRLRAAIAFLQAADLEMGRILRQMVDRRLFVELGFPGLARYAEERLDVSGRTARRLVALARNEGRAPEVAVAFRRGRIHAFQARVLARVAAPDGARAWVERAQEVSLRQLEEDVEQAEPARAAIAFRAPADVAELFLAMVARAGRWSGCWPTPSAPGWSWASSSRMMRTSNGTASAARCRAARRGGTSRATTSASARPGGRTSPGTGRRSARTTTCGAPTAGRCASGGGHRMSWPTRSGRSRGRPSRRETGE